ncbi:protein MAIN-LIKE 2-like [Manihot esculenta]|uniref:protein MAIN-LIKE 2-like n=1 Tax=Manihot esculenta TaxID=3983 RepID=UPI000B5D2388|nr:protein MAIN-LIKE 2-like [Manihot esculenta]
MEVGAIACRRTGTILHLDDIPDQIIPYLRRTGFYGVIRLGFFALDWHLISTLVERWRPETHTFMFPEGEMTITLQDVGLITGLPVNGAAVTGRSRHHWPSVCEALLGVVPPNSAIRGCYLKMVWLAEEFSQLPDDSDKEVVQRFARAYIMRVIGSIFSDTSASRVNLMFLPLLADLEEAGNYSWGGTCLTWLYKQLCKATNPEVMQMAGGWSGAYARYGDKSDHGEHDIYLRPPTICFILYDGREAANTVSSSTSSTYSTTHHC